jgi:hypothetical protein
MQAQTRRGSIGKLLAKGCGIAALVLNLGFGFVADVAAAWGGSGRGPAVDTSRATTQTSGAHGGTLASRR